MHHLALVGVLLAELTQHYWQPDSVGLTKVSSYIRWLLSRLGKLSATDSRQWLVHAQT